MINQVVLIGRLVRDVELRKTTSGKSTVSFSLAVNRMKAGESGQDVDFITCVAWNKTAENMEKYLKKGSLIGVEGRIQSRTYKNKQGSTVSVNEVLVNQLHFLETKRGQQQNTQAQGQQADSQAYSQSDNGYYDPNQYDNYNYPF